MTALAHIMPGRAGRALPRSAIKKCLRTCGKAFFLCCHNLVDCCRSVFPHSAPLVFLAGMTLEKQGKWGAALHTYALADAQGGITAREIFGLRKAACLVKLKRHDEAAALLREIVALHPNSRNASRRLASLLPARKSWWEVIEHLPRHLSRWPEASLYSDLGRACARMGRLAEAAEAFETSAQMGCANRALLYFQAGRSRRLIGDIQGAQADFCRAENCDSSGRSRRFGLGEFFADLRLWPQAAEAYQQKLTERPGDAELWSRLATALEHCHEWQGAAEAYTQVLFLGRPVADDYFRLGYARERLGNLEGAAQGYSLALGLRPTDTAIVYRLGRVLAKSGCHAKACAVFASLPSSRAAAKAWDTPERLEKRLSRAYGHFGLYERLGDAHMGRSEWERATVAYQAALDRCSAHRPMPGLCRKLGEALAAAGRFAEACAAFEETLLFGRVDGEDAAQFTCSAPVRRSCVYTEYCETKALRPKHILYESFMGRTVGCNPLAICRYLLEQPDFQDHTHIWAATADAPIPPDLRNRHNVIVILRESVGYLRHLATASFLVNNVSFPSYFSRREGQRYCNTWHGTPLKYLGRDINSPPLSYINAARNFLHATHIISPNAFTGKVLTEHYGIAGLWRGALAETGYPRNDRLFSLRPEERRALRARFGAGQGEKLVLYAPTWRGDYDKPRQDAERLLENIRLMASLPCKLVFRPHHLLRGLKRKARPYAMEVGQEVDITQLLAAADILVTDYSSLLFDFLPTRRPIIFYVPDREAYARERGLYFSMEEMPGDLCGSPEELQATLARRLAADFMPDARYLAALEKFCPHEDGRATERAVDFFFRQRPGPAVQTQAGRRPGFLFCAGNFLPNGITASFRNLAEGLDAAGIQSHVAVEAAGVAPFPDRSERLRQLPASMEVIGRVGVMAATKEERRVLARLAAFHWQDEPPLSAAMRRVVRTAYKREWRRVFADSQFSSLIAFDGYSTYWTELFAAAEAPRKIIFMHSDLYGEYMLKYPTLARVFACYADFDRLVSVSETACAVNRESLAGRYALPEEKFVWRHNLLSPIRTCEQAAQPLDADIADWLGDTPCFTAIGRLSPEKGLDRLIRAFAAMRRESPQTRLVIAGDGPLKSELRQLADTLGQSEHILFAGYRGNPFPLLRRADCLAFSSVHEGQPMVLLEAMLLGRPVVAADIPPVRDVLGDNYGMLVENSEQGLREGMRAFGNGKRADGSFDYLAFQNAALQGFFSLMQGAGK